jgi:hypothetical protein
VVDIPDRLYVGRGDKEIYDRLEREWILRGKTRKEQFLLAMAYGFKSGLRRPLDHREEFFLRKDLRIEDEALLYAVAIQAEGKLDVLCDKEKVFRIAQEYAHAGIRLLDGEVASTSFGTFEKKFEKGLFDVFEEIAATSVTDPA